MQTDSTTARAGVLFFGGFSNVKFRVLTEKEQDAGNLGGEFNGRSLMKLSTSLP